MNTIVANGFKRSVVIFAKELALYWSSGDCDSAQDTKFIIESATPRIQLNVVSNPEYIRGKVCCQSIDTLAQTLGLVMTKVTDASRSQITVKIKLA